MEKELTNKQNSLKWGLYAALGMIAVALLLWALTDQTNKWLGFTVYLPFFFLATMGAMEYRKKALNDVMTYGQAFNSLFLIGLVASIIYVVYSFVYVKFIDPEAAVRALEMAEEEMLRRMPDISDEQLDMSLSMSKKMLTPLGMAISGFINNIVVSLLVAVVASFVIKRPENQVAKS